MRYPSNQWLLACLLVWSVIVDLVQSYHGYYFRGSGSGSCNGKCGGKSSSCYCDAACLRYHDCCYDLRPRCRVPSVVGVTPSVGTTSGNTMITVTGTNFENEDCGVGHTGSCTQGKRGIIKFSGSTGPSCTISTWTNVKITCYSPAGVGKDFRIYIQNIFWNGCGAPNYCNQAATSSSSLVFSYSPPSISGIAPGSGPTGPAASTATIVISGDNFGGSGATVKIDNNDCVVSSQGHTSITCKTPVGQGLVRPVIVTAGTQNSFQSSFSYQGPSISSTSGSGFTTSGGQTLTIHGSSMGTSGATATVGGVNCGVTHQDHTRVECTLPAGQGTNVAVRVTVDPQESNTLQFNYPAPVVSGISGQAAGTWLTTGGQTVIISGSNFGTSGSVSIGSTDIASSGGNHGQSQILVTMPAGQGVNIELKVTVSGQVSNAVTFSYGAPVVTSVAAIGNDFPTNGGTLITVNGHNFGQSASITVGGSSCALGQLTASYITCTLPAGQGLNRPVVVTVSSQTNVASSNAEVDYNPPKATGVNPTSGPTNGGLTLVISGSDFGSASGTVNLVGNVDGTQVSFPCYTSSWGQSSISCGLPAGEGTGLSVQVTASGQTQTVAMPSFSYQQPTLTFASPLTDTTAGGQSLTLTGTNFGRTPVVTIGGVSCGSVVVSSNDGKITCSVPQSTNVVNPLNIVLKVKSYTQLQYGSSFNYDAPSILTVTPTFGFTSGNTLITVTGSSFGSPAGEIRIGGHSGPQCNVQTWTHTQITCTTPQSEGSGQQVSIKATGTNYQNTLSSSHIFDYVAPYISYVTPSSAVTGGAAPPTVIMLVGSSFGVSTPTIMVDGSNPCGSVSGHTHTSVQCQLPDGAGASVPIVLTVGGQTSNTITFDYSPPSISSISPTSFSTGGSTTLILYGTSFGASSTPFTGRSVEVGDIPCDITSNTHTQTECTLRAGTGSSNRVRITVEGQSSTSSVFFAYLPPTITGLSASSFPTAGGSNVVLTGTNFGENRLVASVQVNGVPGSVNVDPSHTSLTFVLPAGEGVNRDVIVTIDGQSSNAWQLSYDVPEIASSNGINPASGGTVGGSVVAVTGTNFGTTATVTIGGVECYDPVRTPNTKVVCKVPEGQGKDLPVVVRVQAQTSVEDVKFSYTQPAITPPLDPTSSQTSGSITMTIDGSNFGLSGTVTIGTQECFPVSGGWTHAQVKCSIPPGEGVNLDVIVSVADQDSASQTFSYNAPTITDVTPLSGTTAGGYPITVTGTNFGVGSARVYIGSEVCDISFLSHVRIVCVKSPGYGSALPIKVYVVGHGNTTASETFTYVDPTIVTLTPATGKTNGGYLLTVTGSSFGSAWGRVDIGASECTQNYPATLWTHDKVVCQAPPGIGTQKSVMVQAADGKSETEADRFSYDAPQIVSIDPNVAYTGGGPRDLSIHGTSLGTGTQASVKVGTLSCHVTSNDHELIVCTIPENQGEDITVTVTVDTQESNSVSFSYAPPTITSIYPPKASTAGGTLLTLHGTSLGTSGSLTIGQRSSTIVYHNHTEIIARVPAGEGVLLSLQLRVSAQLSTSLVTFSYDAPNITGINPTTGNTVGGDTIQIQGFNFGLGTAIVQIGGKVCPTVSNTLVDQLTGSTVDCILPVGEDTNKEVQIIVASQVGTGSVTFSYNGPTLQSLGAVSPNTGPTDGGTVVEIFGANFGTSGYATIGGARCLSTGVPVVDSGTSGNAKITCATPEGLGRSLTVQVFVGSQSVSSLHLSKFSYNHPDITHVSPLNGPTLGGTIITIEGSSFSTVPLVKIGSSPCTLALSGNTHSYIRCSLPSGQGDDHTISVEWTGYSQFAQSFTSKFSYNPPTVTNVQPTLGPTNGGVMLTISGVNFGTSGTVTIGDNECDTSNGGLYSQGVIECLLPAGRGAGLSVKVEVSTLFNNPTYLYSYRAPTLTAMYPLSGITSGGYNISLFGTDFGCVEGTSGVPSTVRVFFSSSQLTPIACNYSVIVFSAPPGEGGPYSASVSIGGQQSLSVGGFVYAPPVIKNVSGCTDVGDMTESCPVVGGTKTITVNGENFGNTGGGLELKIDDKVCAGATVTIPHRQIQCTLPKGVGFNLMVRVTTGFQYDEKPYLSYVHPEIVDETLDTIPSSGRPGSQNITSVSGGETMIFVVKNVPVVPGGNVWITYGAADHDHRYNCSIINITAIDTEQRTVRCKLDAGVGEKLTFRVTVFESGFDPQISADGTDQLWYPRPELIDGTIRSEFGVEGISLQSTSSQGQLVLFRASNIGSDASLLRVRYGPRYNMSSTLEDNDAMYQCLQVRLTGSTNQLECMTSPGHGNDLVFQVIALNSVSKPGNDSYNYPQPPEVTSVSSTGCTNVPPKTIDCPTAGGVRLQIFGSNFADNSNAAVVKVGSQTCSGYVYVNSGEISCILPEGTGSNQVVTVINNGLNSIPKELVSYARPVITSIEVVAGAHECDAVSGDSTILESCPRDKSARIQLVGSNFGPSGAIILVGGASCTAVEHLQSSPHDHVSCALPDGRGVNRAVFMVQGGGEASQETNNVRISYELCPVGTRNDFDPTVTTCQVCTPGTFASKLDSLLCDVCEAGFYSNGTAATVCSPCVPGLYSSQGAANCTQCDKGEFAEFPASASCKQCPAGRAYGTTGGSLCDRCVAGKYASTSGRSNCDSCAAGSFSADEALICDLCPPGRFSDGLQECQDCAAGRYQPSSGKSQCIEAPKGAHVSASGQFEFVACDSGTYSNDTELTMCFRCDPGYFSAKDSGSVLGPQSCEKCSAGDYMNVYGQGVCLKCIKGEWNNKTASTTCAKCQRGRVSETIGSTVCKACDRGFFAFTDGLGQCEPCEYGHYAKSSGASSCTPCDDGWAQPARGSSSCFECREDTFTSAQAQASCSQCPMGKFSAANGTSSCDKCSSGFFKDVGTALAQCEVCLPGYFSSGEGQGVCQPCDLGTYSATNASSCITCEPGYYAPVSASTKCSACLAGYISPGWKADSCVSCSTGFSQSLPANDTCIECPAGRAQGKTAQKSCVDCLPGYYSPIAAQGVCLICPSGKFSNESKATTCYTCKKGEYLTGAGNTKCSKCSPGTYGAAVGLPLCTDCPPGEYQPNSGATTCLLCAKGRFAGAARLSACTNCTAGRYSADKGSFSCALCQKGEYNGAQGLTGCKLCDAGLYQSSVGQSGCLFCAAAKYAPGEGEAQCQTCPPGRYSSVNDSKILECAACSPGYYQDSSFTTSCKKCATGRYSIGNASLGCEKCAAGLVNPEMGKSMCTQCERGYYQVKSGEEKCDACPRGRYQSSGGQAFCQLCSAGTMMNMTNATACTPCSRGYIASTQEALKCDPCDPGYYVSAIGQAECLPCRFGTYANVSAASTCDLCATGRKQNLLAQTRCTDCSKGRFADVRGKSACRACDPGFFAAGEENSFCTVCVAGRVQDKSEADECTSCTSGYYSPSDGQYVCLSCPSGKFSNGTDIEDCTACSPGEYAASVASDSCSKCPAGQYSNSFSRRECSLCPEGRHQPSTGRTKCEHCTPGKYTTSQGESKCSPCNPGEFTPSNATITCSVCGVGLFTNKTGQEQCELCQPGKYQDEVGQQSCKFCDAGGYAPGVGEVACLQCLPGTYNPGGEDGGASCSLCEPGKAQSQSGKGQCDPCGRGEFAFNNGSKVCSNCIVGTAANTTGHSRCEFCDVGKFTDATKTFVCESCKPGQSQSYTGQTECASCKSGFFASSFGSRNCTRCVAGRVSVKAPTGSVGPTECDKCKAGTYINLPGQLACLLCERGYAVNEDGQTACSACNKGFFADREGASQCKPCLEGTYASRNATEKCLPCEAGKSVNSQQATTCINCARGRYQNGIQATSCRPCDFGWYGRSEGQVQCLQCDTGKFTDILGQVNCTSCAPGRFANESGTRDCYNCTDGYYQPASGQIGCIPCPLRTHGNGNQADACTTCELGKFGDEPGLRLCKDCRPGFVQGNRGQLECLACSRGRFQNESGQAACELCPAGSYETRQNSTKCQLCPKGRYSPVKGSDVCLPCPVGTKAPNLGTSVCEPCVSGYFQNFTGRSVCSECPKGSYAAVNGSDVCVKCSPGTYSKFKGATRCLNCAPGRFMVGVGASVCEECAMKEYQPLSAQLSCVPCPSGTFGNDTGLDACFRCHRGYSNKVTGVSACTQCKVGYHADILGQTSCSPCQQGRFTNENKTIACSTCGTGYFQSRIATTRCDECSVGKFSSLPGQKVCTACPAGRKSNTTGLPNCIKCAPGEYQPLTNQTICLQCPKGRFSPVAGLSTCQLCQRGRAAASPGQRQCQLCQKGNFANSTGFTSCIKCELGTFANATESSECDLCPTGKYMNEKGQSFCMRCNPGEFQSLSGKTKCDNCTAGEFSGRYEQALCLRCDVTTYAPNDGMSRCESCVKGKFQNLTGQTRCVDCFMGTYGESGGLRTCSPCLEGTANNRTGVSACDDCARGYITSTRGQLQCQKCDRGTSAPNSRMSVCKLCVTGRFNMYKGRATCDACPKGRFQNSEGASKCFNCTSGTFAQNFASPLCSNCLVGRATNDTGKVECDKCNQGRFANDTALTKCFACDLGTYASESGQQRCELCPIGRKSSSLNSSECELCPGGRAQRDTGQSACVKCSPGYFSTPGQPNKECPRCSSGTVSAVFGSTTCQACGTTATSNENRTICVCDVGYYTPDGEGEIRCLECPDGADCSEPGTTMNSMTTSRGWWRPNPNSLNFYRCLRQQHCVGGRNSECGIHRYRVLCAICRPGYHSVFGGECQPCPQAGASWVFLVFVFLCMAGVYWGSMYVVIRGGRDLLEKESELARRAAFYGSYQSEAALDKTGTEETEKEVVKLKKDFIIQYPAEFMFKLKILVTFLQIVTNIGVALEVPWPPEFKSFISFFSLANLDLIQASSAECEMEAGFYRKFIIMSVLPPACMIVLVLLYVIPQYRLIDQRLSSLDAEERASEQLVRRKAVRRNYWKMVIFSFFLLYPVVSSTVFRVFVCKRVEGVKYLLADMRFTCDTNEWKGYATAAGFLIVLYPVGIPAMFFYFLWKYRKQNRLQEPGVKAQLGVLYDAFDSSLWWFELADMLHKLILTSLLAFFPDDLQLPAGLFTVVIYSCVLLLSKPYKRKGDDRLHMLCQVEILLYLYAGYLFYLEIDTDKNYNAVMAVVMITMTLGVLAFFGSQFASVLYKKFKKWQLDRIMADPRKARAYRSKQRDRGISESGAMELVRSQLTEKDIVRKDQFDLRNQNLQLMRNPLAGMSSERQVHMADVLGETNQEEEDVSMVGNPMFGAEMPLPVDKRPRQESFIAEPELE